MTPEMYALCAVIIAVVIYVCYRMNIAGLGSGMGVFSPSTAYLAGKYVVIPDGNRYYVQDGIAYWVSPTCKQGDDPVEVDATFITDRGLTGGGDLRQSKLAGKC